MDINFHYFAVKTLAKAAGFKENDAQQIAAYSQFVDDFDWIVYKDSNNIPDYIKKSKEYDLYASSPATLNLNFNPAMTGFTDIADMAFLLEERTQQFTVSPFHFIPKTANKTKKVDAKLKETRTVPAEIGDGSIISDWLLEAQKTLESGKEDRNLSLMRIGMLLHTFADTYAHQLFSGYNSWVNDVKLVSVKNNIKTKNANITDIILKQIKNDDLKLMKKQNAEAISLPQIGHMWAGHAPDLTNVSFEIGYKKNKNDKGYSLSYSRSNTETFTVASRHILNYLRSCNGKDPMPDNEWAAFAEILQKGFLVELPSKNAETKLAAHWKKCFPKNEYAYSKKAVENGFLNSGKNYTDAFYQYNCLADQTLINMYGPQPRKAWFNKQLLGKAIYVADVITLEQLCKINKNKNVEDCLYYIEAFNKILPSYQINLPLRLAHFFAQIIYESGNLHSKEENLNYSAQRLREVFPKYFKTDDIASKYAKNPEKIANRVYCNRMGNGNESSGDGWKFRGRGLIQLTGRDNYKACGDALKLDLLANPDLLCQSPENIVRSACWYWASKNLNKLADADDIMAITKRVNGGLNGLESRKSYLLAAKKALGC
jgi:putative chitinase